jgi:hypothetical protein
MLRPCRPKSAAHKHKQTTNTPVDMPRVIRRLGGVQTWGPYTRVAVPIQSLVRTIGWPRRPQGHSQDGRARLFEDRSGGSVVAREAALTEQRHVLGKIFAPSQQGAGFSRSPERPDVRSFSAHPRRFSAECRTAQASQRACPHATIAIFDLRSTLITRPLSSSSEPGRPASTRSPTLGMYIRFAIFYSSLSVVVGVNRMSMVHSAAFFFSTATIAASSSACWVSSQILVIFSAACG